MKEIILVTGSNGMVGQQVVKGLLDEGYRVIGVDTGGSKGIENNQFKYISTDLTRTIQVARLLNDNNFSHIIHLAAIAHSVKGVNISWSRYYRVNTLISHQIFEYASKKQIPVYFASTVDVYGVTKGKVTPETECSPIGEYAKSKYAAENALIEICNSSPYTIARFSPVYSDKNSTDIMKRYYLRYPKLCYRIGKGIEYEFLNVKKIVENVVQWANSPRKQIILNLYDEFPANTRDMINEERKNGRANFVIQVPMWMIKCLHFGVNTFFGKRSYKAFMISKLITPITFEREYNGL
jgi:nucleoside-diphosphate-sugar epimerase